MSRRVISIVEAIISLVCLVWFLQGASVIPGSVMSDSQFWEMAGGLTLIAGIVISASSLRG